MSTSANSEYVLENAGEGFFTELFPSNFVYHRFYSLNAYTIASSYIEIQLNSTGENKARNLETFKKVIQNIPKVQHKANIYRFIMIAVVILIIWYYSSKNYPDTETSKFRNVYYLYAVGVVGALGFIYYQVYTDALIQRECIDLYNNIIQKLDPIIGDGKDKQLIYKNLNDAIGPQSYFTSSGIFIGNFPFGVNLNSSNINPAVKTGIETAVALDVVSNLFGNNNRNNRMQYY
jgi:hypothetical protein